MSPFDFKLAFSNLDRIWVWLLKQSCRTLNLEQLLFLEIFEFPYKFESNLRNEANGNSVNTLNSASRQTLTIGEFPPASMHARRPHLWLRHVCTAMACQTHRSPPLFAHLLSLERPPVALPPFLYFSRQRRLAVLSSRRNRLALLVSAEHVTMIAIT